MPQSLQCQPYTVLSPFMPPSPLLKAQGAGNQRPAIPRDAGMEDKAQEKLLIEGLWADGTAPERTRPRRAPLECACLQGPKSHPRQEGP